MAPGETAPFRLRAWRGAGDAPWETFSGSLQDLRAQAVRLLQDGGAVRAELSAWSLELNDWTPMERLAA